ncbi:MAG TPA: hypothetical protein VJN92_01855 [Candidatus Acidoferrum sp.]|nr:hypothetical protein [Candidatus Acidoferrum sp.]
MKPILEILVLLAAPLSTMAQSTPPRTPGRVAASPNNPSILRPRGGTGGSVHALDASTALSADEQKQYQLAKQAIPDLTVYDFFRIENLSKALKDRKIEIDPPTLAQKIAGTKNHVVAALEKLGVEKKEAKKINTEAKKEADTRVTQNF